MEVDPYSPYCSVCGACGEEGCCSASKCTQSPEGHHCDYYLKHLKYVDQSYDAILKYIYDNEDKYKELIEVLFKIDQDIYDEHYKKHETESDTEQD